jgi:hypothetical protein
MGTKNNPGKFDCYENAEPDEPMFILLARDPTASFLVELWAKVREEIGDTDHDKLDEARHCAAMMQRFAVEEKGKQGKVDMARSRFHKVIIALGKKFEGA